MTHPGPGLPPGSPHPDAPPLPPPSPRVGSWAWLVTCLLLAAAPTLIGQLR